MTYCHTDQRLAWVVQFEVSRVRLGRFVLGLGVRGFLGRGAREAVCQFWGAQRVMRAPGQRARFYLSRPWVLR